MDENVLQVGKTRYTHYSITYHLVWIPKYRRRMLTGEVQKETKRLIAEYCERQGLTLLALETDEDHIHVCVSAPPRFSPALIANLLKGSSSRYLREKFPHLKSVKTRLAASYSRAIRSRSRAISLSAIRSPLFRCHE